MSARRLLCVLLASACVVTAARADWSAGAPEAPHGKTGTACSACHLTSSWTQVKFDHERTGFALHGAHQKLQCASCHGGDLARKLPVSCAGCHADTHTGEFGTRCASCHEETSWRPLFDVDAHRRTNFPLTGRHALMPCQECHLDRRDRSFTRAALDCAGCHRADYDRTGALTIDHAAAGFGTNCRQCHVPWSWKDARFAAHETCFQIASGKHAGIRCRDCHTSLPTTTSASCDTGTASCQRCHTCGQVTPRHRDVSGFQCQDAKCYQCHRFSFSSDAPPARPRWGK
ncbi:MAG: cytochrome C [Deltaproteobacteria bacterium]|nr:cytochrome C [Deltaproteobacteria bacterium]